MSSEVSHRIHGSRQEPRGYYRPSVDTQALRASSHNAEGIPEGYSGSVVVLFVSLRRPLPLHLSQAEHRSHDLVERGAGIDLVRRAPT